MWYGLQRELSAQCSKEGGSGTMIGDIDLRAFTGFGDRPVPIIQEPSTAQLLRAPTHPFRASIPIPTHLQLEYAHRREARHHRWSGR
jgi:hypothetical protein